METTNLQEYAWQIASQASQAQRSLEVASSKRKNAWLRKTAKNLIHHAPMILQANEQDLKDAEASDLSSASLDRLKLTPKRIEGIAEGLRQIAALPDPIGEVLERKKRPNGLIIRKKRVPLGVIFFIYESRPNVTVDAAGLCLKSGNAVILRGGKEAIHTNRALHAVLLENLQEYELPPSAIQLVSTTDRAAVTHFLKCSDFITLTIPRGGPELIKRVVADATMPVLKHDRGNCHIYVDADADLEMALRIVENAKCQRPGVCNAAESLLVHQAVAEEFLPRLARIFQERGVLIRGCAETCRILPHARPATDTDYEAEYLDLIISNRVVMSVDQAIEHINRFGSGHSEAIVTNNKKAARRFLKLVDASAVLMNASTRFNDGFELGLGAEIGISTDKFHARGPCGLNELTTYKYLIHGSGQIRE